MTGSSAAPVAAPSLTRHGLRVSRARPVAAHGSWTVLRVALDVLALLAAVAFASALGATVRLAPVVTFVPLAVLLLGVHGLYRHRLRLRVLDSFVPFVSALSLAGMGSVVVAGLVDRGTAVDDLAALWACAVVLAGAERLAMAGAHHLLRHSGRLSERTLVVGAGEIGARVAARLADHPVYGLEPVGFLDANPPEERPITGLPVLGGPADMATVAPLLGVRHVIFAFSAAPDRLVLSAIRDAQRLGLRVSLVPRFFDALNDQTTYEAVGGLPLLRLRPTDSRDPRFLVKHLLDRVVAAVALVVLSPLLAAVAVAVRTSSAGPVLFRQRRVGLDGREFELLKFRSMAPVAPPAAAEHETWRGVAPGGVEGGDRRTRVGRVLRRASLDELPQLLNVVRGEMSLVGPRPERPDYVELFEQGVARYGERHRVRGGMTGWAQVHGLRGQTSLAERIELDNWYIEHWSLALDLKVLLMTALAVLRPAE